VAGAGGGCITVRSVLLQATAADMQITAAANRALDVMVVSLDEPGRPPHQLGGCGPTVDRSRKPRAS
jgi:hypothetical protein